ncbi:sugar nucleotide-binding protein [Mycobacterium sp. G7A2]|uniref:sugar nucleotide-binding protein n=1 Tax=Mycobacterium sp. G7A2 TaxID=3317307 RepID=UPI0035A85E4E
MTQYEKPLLSSETPIPGLLLWDLTVHGDNRGWFKETWQREKMLAAGLPDFGPVQTNVSFNFAVGTTRGIHAEPWDKFVSVATGKVFGAWVDLREGETFGTVFTAELDPSRAVFVPRGVGNAFQTLQPNTSYVYMVNDHWTADREYVSVDLADETLAIGWPISLCRSELSTKDRGNPRLADIAPIATRKTLILGADGQLGRALRKVYGERTNVEFASRSDFDLAMPGTALDRCWRDYDTIINAAAYTAVDTAETPGGRADAWATNVTGLARLARIATLNGITLVQISSDYVFDGTAQRPYREDDPVTPMGVYGQTKAAGDQITATVPRHYIVRTSWLIGDGHNFVRTMLSLAARGISPRVVNDQYGRLTFTSELAQAIRHLLERRPPYGIYNVSGSGPVGSWADIARRTFALAGSDPNRITDVSTAEYSIGTSGPISPRPHNSVLDLERIRSTGLSPRDADNTLKQYVEQCWS